MGEIVPLSGAIVVGGTSCMREQLEKEKRWVDRRCQTTLRKALGRSVWPKRKRENSRVGFRSSTTLEHRVMIINQRGLHVSVGLLQASAAPFTNGCACQLPLVQLGKKQGPKIILNTSWLLRCKIFKCYAFSC